MTNQIVIIVTKNVLGRTQDARVTRLGTSGRDGTVRYGKVRIGKVKARLDDLEEERGGEVSNG